MLDLVSGRFGFRGGFVALPILAPLGTTSAPSYSFASDPTSGFYRGANTNRLLFTIGATNSLAIFGTLLRVRSVSGFGWTSSPSDADGGGTDLALMRDGADILALRRATNAQRFNIYNTYTDASNYEVGYAAWVSGNVFEFGTAGAGTGSNNRSLRFVSGGTIILTMGATQFQVGQRPLTWLVDNAQDIGLNATSNRPRNLFLGGYARFTPVAFSALPSAATVGAGTRYFISDALAPVFGSAAVGGGAVTAPVYSDGVTWLVG